MQRFECNLSQFLKEKNTEYGLFERIKLAFKIVVEVSKVHKSEIVHRDIKPSNIMLKYYPFEYNLSLIDFGIAHFGRCKVAAGTPGFTAPEQISGEDHFQSADVYSLGKVLVLTLFDWRVGWQILWTPKLLTESNNLKFLADLFELIQKMLQVIKKIIQHFKKYSTLLTRGF